MSNIEDKHNSFLLWYIFYTQASLFYLLSVHSLQKCLFIKYKSMKNLIEAVRVWAKEFNILEKLFN